MDGRTDTAHFLHIYVYHILQNVWAILGMLESTLRGWVLGPTPWLSTSLVFEERAWDRRY